MLIAKPARLVLLSLAMLIGPDGAGQGSFSKLGPAEKRWALFHPFAAMKVRAINDQCTRFYDNAKTRTLLDSFPSGGKLDAFRHVFSMAAFAQRISVKKVRKLGIAHERTNYRQFRRGQLEEGERPDSLSCEMDLRNNELGLKIGCNYREMNLDQLSDLVATRIRAGEAWILKRDAKGRYTSCDGKPLDLQAFREFWHVPKCLVSSSHVPKS